MSKKKICFVAQFPPPMHGLSKAVETLYNSELNNEMNSNSDLVFEKVSIDALEKIDFSILALGEDHKGGRFDEVEEWCNQNGKKVVRLKRTPGICSSDIKKSV